MHTWVSGLLGTTLRIKHLYNYHEQPHLKILTNYPTRNNFLHFNCILNMSLNYKIIIITSYISILDFDWLIAGIFVMYFHISNEFLFNLTTTGDHIGWRNGQRTRLVVVYGKCIFPFHLSPSKVIRKLSSLSFNVM